jgi:hypothetical protein
MVTDVRLSAAVDPAVSLTASFYPRAPGPRQTLLIDERPFIVAPKN